MAVCLFTVPVLSGPINTGEHPWGSDRTGDTTTKPTIVSYEDSVAAAGNTTVTTIPPSDGTDSIVQIILTVTTSLSMIW